MSGFTFGAVSIGRLNTCHPDLQRVMRAAIADAPMDFGIACGHRNEAEQNEAFARGLSKLKWPKGEHNKLPSRAVDILPILPGENGRAGRNAWGWMQDAASAGLAQAEIDARLYAAFRACRDHIWTHAARLGIPIYSSASPRGLRWGGDWDGDGLSRHDGDPDERFVDLPHFELKA